MSNVHYAGKSANVSVAGNNKIILQTNRRYKCYVKIRHLAND